MSDINRLSLCEKYFDSERWAVRRFCQEDWVLNVRVQRVVDRRHFKIALFLAEDHEKYVRDAGVMGGLILALSEAYDKTGSMRIQFVKHERCVPECIRRV